MLKQRLGRIYIAEKKAIEQGLDKKPEVRLQMMLQQARVLAQKYAVDKLQEKMKATDEEVTRISRVIRNWTPIRRTVRRLKKF